MSQIAYSELEQDNIFATAGVNVKPIMRRTDTKRLYDVQLINKVGEVVHTLKDQPAITTGIMKAANWCVANRGGRPRDLTNEQKQDLRVGDVEARLADTEMKLAALQKAAAPADGDAPAPKPKKKKAKAEEGGDPPSEQ